MCLGLDRLSRHWMGLESVVQANQCQTPEVSEQDTLNLPNRFKHTWNQTISQSFIVLHCDILWLMRILFVLPIHLSFFRMRANLQGQRMPLVFFCPKGCPTLNLAQHYCFQDEVNRTWNEDSIRLDCLINGNGHVSLGWMGVSYDHSIQIKGYLLDDWTACFSHPTEAILCFCLI